MVHEELWQQLDRLDRRQTSQRAKCQYLSGSEQYIITFLNSQYTVNLIDRAIVTARPDSKYEPADYLSQLCLLTYLVRAKDLPLADRLVKAESLPGGLFFFRGLHEMPTQKLANTFGEKPAQLYEAASRLNAERCEFKDASVKLYALPRIPLTFIIWATDEQFAARASILFDSTAHVHLPLDALLAAVTLAVKVLIRSGPKGS